MKRRIFWAMCILALISIVLTSFSVCALSYNGFLQNREDVLKDEVAYVATAIETEGKSYLTNLVGTTANNRITLIAQDGKVIYDNEVDAATMGNHIERQEVKDAISKGVGEDSRLSTTMGQRTFYYATLLNDGSILRMAETNDSIFATFLSILPWVIALTLIIFLLVLIISNKQAKWILAPLNNFDLEHPTENDAYEELSPLLLKIHQQNDKIKDQLTALEQHQREFNAITENMSEGLILLGRNSHILSINQSAKNILAKDSNDDFVDCHILEMNRNLSLQKVAETSLKGASAQETFTQDNTCCIIQGSPVYQGGVIKGAILLVMDVTERYKIEQMRREFSANVSHELKTPLTAISGYAELLENQMVKPEDIGNFSQRIHEEALRLIALIDDIIELSRLDERSITYLWEEIDLFAMVQDVGLRLDYLAKSKDISINITGAIAEFRAVPRLMDELIYNLVDNAIKYSENGSAIDISVENTDSAIVLSVADHGLGIPSEYQDRIFERFFRVDQSHAKTTGGTGLGLAIVKHVTNYHHGSIILNSTFGEGTNIVVTFPQ